VISLKPNQFMDGLNAPPKVTEGMRLHFWTVPREDMFICRCMNFPWITVTRDDPDQAYKLARHLSLVYVSACKDRKTAPKFVECARRAPSDVTVKISRVW